ncbi:MAG: AI-2E family transporter [Bradyrhizobiaceae bacterium]|nr:AI-2E family transporter [Bradyrhizobiaceae bacterium]
MNLQRQVIFWVGALIVFILFTWILSDVLLPFVAGIALAYFLNPLADRLESYGFNRLVATLLVTGVFALFFIAVAIIVIPLLGSQLFAFISRIPEYVTRLQQLLLDEAVQDRLHALLGGEKIDLRKTVGDLMGQGATWLGTFLQGLWSGGRALISLVAVVVIMPIVAFYVLVDWHRMVAKVDSWLPRRHRKTIHGLAREIDAALAGFIRGQGLVTLILGTFYAVGLTLVGLNFGLLIGFGAGILSFVPYIGSTTGLLIAGGVAFAQFWPDWIWIVSVVVIFFVGQFIEGYFLQPKLVGDRVGLHPVWLIFALFAFGYLLGFVGILLAVPLAAVTGVLTRFALKQYLASPLYTGETRQSSSEKSGRR